MPDSGRARNRAGLISIFDELDDVLDDVLSRLWAPDLRATKRPSVMDKKGRWSVD
jgi:hypothetical protein